jgi:uncharacterized iron-regulated membrane protein
MKKFCLFLLCLAGIVFLFSCASGPATEAVDLTTAQNRAAAALEKAKSVKADVAVKPEFDKAQASYSEAQGMTGEAAIPKYLEAESLFLAAYDAAVAKRAEAQKQLEKAKADIKAVEDEETSLKQEQGGAR